jgi:hypothetical protein
MQAGELKEDGTYQSVTLNYLIIKRLTEITKAIKEKREEEKEEKQKDK